MHIDVCAIPSFDIEKRALINHYNIVVPTEGLLIPVQSLQETLADKFIALAYRARRIKPRDVWDIVWIKQRGVGVSQELINKKLEARKKTKADFTAALGFQVDKLLQDDNPDYWAYVQSEVNSMSMPLLTGDKSANKFDMGF